MYGFEIFHEELMKSLLRAVQQDECGHAYLFEGAAGLGKHAAAGLLAMAMACYSPENAPCGICDACVQAKGGSNPDIIHIHAGGKKSISVEVIREMTKDAYVKPFEAMKKVYIIDNADIMTEQAQNAFLKLLEEPPVYAVFILIAENASALLQTILSRCMLVRFAPVREDVVAGYIQRKYPEETDRISFLTRYAKGIPGAVDQVVGMPEFEDLRRASAQMLSALLSRRSLSAYAVRDFLEEHKEDAGLILDFWIDFLRDAMMLQQDCPKLLLNQDLHENIRKIAESFEPQKVLFALEQVIRAKWMLKRFVKLQAIAFNMSFSIKKGFYFS